MIVLIRIQDAFTPLPLRLQGNFDSICVFLHEYKLFWTGSCSFELVAGWLGGGGQFWVGGCGWFQVVSDGFGWFLVVCCFSSYAHLKVKWMDYGDILFEPFKNILWRRKKRYQVNKPIFTYFLFIYLFVSFISL